VFFLEQATAETNPIRMRDCMVRNEHLSELALEWSNSHGTHDNEKNIFKQMDRQHEQSVVGVGKSRICSEHPHQKPPKRVSRTAAAVGRPE